MPTPQNLSLVASILPLYTPGRAPDARSCCLQPAGDLRRKPCPHLLAHMKPPPTPHLSPCPQKAPHLPDDPLAHGKIPPPRPPGGCWGDAGRETILPVVRPLAERPGRLPPTGAPQWTTVILSFRVISVGFQLYIQYTKMY